LPPLVAFPRSRTRGVPIMSILTIVIVVLLVLLVLGFFGRGRFSR
jgi:phosphotransferase system  glucose/maltose/N-acetylglucosamine-specific IIC component